LVPGHVDTRLSDQFRGGNGVHADNVIRGLDRCGQRRHPDLATVGQAELASATQRSSTPQTRQQPIV
jgi:hypothetical protein